MSQTDPYIRHHSFLPPVIRHFATFIQKFSPWSFRHPHKPKSLSLDTPPSVVLYLQKWERPCCCFCSSNEMPSDLFMNYLFGTAPLCSVHFFYPLWSHVAQWLLMQLFVIQSPSPPVSLRGGLYLSWHVPGCVGGGSDSLSRCEHPLPYCYMPNKSSPAHKLVQGRIMMAI